MLKINPKNRAGKKNNIRYAPAWRIGAKMQALLDIIKQGNHHEA
jgi:hypothetical protein